MLIHRRQPTALLPETLSKQSLRSSKDLDHPVQPMQDRPRNFSTHKKISLASNENNHPRVSQEPSVYTISKPAESMRRFGRLSQDKFVKFISLTSVPISDERINSQQEVAVEKQGVGQTRMNSSRYMAEVERVKNESRAMIDRFASQVGFVLNEQSQKVKQLEALLNHNSQEILQKDRQIQELTKRHASPTYLLTKMKDLEAMIFKVCSLSTPQLTPKLHQLEQILTQFASSKLLSMRKTVEELSFKHSQQLLRLQKAVEPLSTKFLTKLQGLSNRLQANTLQVSKLEASFSQTCKESKIMSAKLTLDESHNQMNYSLGDLSSYERRTEIDQFEDMSPPSSPRNSEEDEEQDYFFRPSLILTSPMKQLLEMVQYRKEPLRCLVSTDGFLKYAESNSYLFDRRGDRLKLAKDEIGYFVGRRLILTE